MLVYRLPGGDVIEHQKRALIISFAGKRTVLCTCPPNGGIRRDLTHIFNHDAKDPDDGFCRMYADTMAEHMREVAVRLGLNPDYTAGLTTAADMPNAAICEENCDNFTVTALVTAGVDKNGGRVGDTADWHEINGQTVYKSDKSLMPPQGTVNIFVFVDAALTDEALLQALATCTEAKCAAMQELLAPSVYSAGIATGSGTDGTVVVCNPDSPVQLTNAGKHYKLGEVIGRVVLSALKEALQKQTDLCAAWQHNAIRRMSRFGVKPDDFAAYPESTVQKLAEDSVMLTKTSLWAHLIDQMVWGLLSPYEAGTEAAHIAESLGFATAEAPQNTDEMVALWRRCFISHLDKMTK